jgi:hypothetical protein
VSANQAYALACTEPLAVALAACGTSSTGNSAGPKAAAYREKYAKAKALFEERCKTAGVVVKRTVKDVEGIELLKVRPKLEWADRRYFDPMFEGAAMADEAQGEDYIASFLYSELRNPNTPKLRGVIQPPHIKSGPNQEPPRRGYRFVDAPDPKGDRLWRYRVDPRLTNEQRRVRSWGGDLERLEPEGARARYAVDYQDLVDSTDRTYWIAGTRISVTDRQTGEVIAQLTRFVWDSGFGTSTTGRWPWQHAGSRVDQKCPYLPGTMGYSTRLFVDTVLIPKQGE